MRWVLLMLIVVGATACRRAPLPEIALTGIDPVIATQISNTVAEVKAAPRSGAAWGKLGMVLKVAGMPSQAKHCFTQA